MSDQNRSIVRRSFAIFALAASTFGTADLAEAGIRYVNAAAAGANNGTKWTDAFTSLQSALDVAAPGDEIWIAQGTYKPTRRELPADQRSVTFQLQRSVALYGGFAGTETSLAQRQLGQHVTTLSGDLAGNDGPDFSNYGENAYHVLRSNGTDKSARLDGFTITAASEGGIVSYLQPEYLTIAHCLITKNLGSSGAGFLFMLGDPLIYRTIFLNNLATGYGGGLFFCDDSQAAPLILNCRFLGNRAFLGGGIATGENGSPLIVNCEFSGNVADRDAGAIYNFDYVVAVNCTFSQNNAGLDLGGAAVRNAVNCIFWGNTDSSGSGQSAQVDPWGDISFSCIQGLTNNAGASNIGLDPHFVDPLGPDGIAGTLDDDLRLQPDSPCIDAGSNPQLCGQLPQSHYGYFGNGCDFVTDLDDHDRYVDNPASPDCAAPAVNCGTFPIIDIGAYEYPPGTPPPRVIGDLNCDGLVNAADAHAFAIAVTGRDAYYIAYPNCQRSNADANDDGIVDGRDISSFAALLLGP